MTPVGHRVENGLSSQASRAVEPRVKSKAFMAAAEWYRRSPTHPTTFFVSGSTTVGPGATTSKRPAMLGCPATMAETMSVVPSSGSGTPVGTPNSTNSTGTFRCPGIPMQGSFLSSHRARVEDGGNDNSGGSRPSNASFDANTLIWCGVRFFTRYIPRKPRPAKVRGWCARQDSNLRLSA